MLLLLFGALILTLYALLQSQSLIFTPLGRVTLTIIVSLSYCFCDRSTHWERNPITSHLVLHRCIQCRRGKISRQTHRFVDFFDRHSTTDLTTSTTTIFASCGVFVLSRKHRRPRTCRSCGHFDDFKRQIRPKSSHSALICTHIPRIKGDNLDIRKIRGISSDNVLHNPPVRLGFLDNPSEFRNQ